MRFLDSIKNIYTKVIYLGLKDVPPEKSRVQRLLNILCLIWINGSLLFLCFGLWINSANAQGYIFQSLITLVVISFVFYLNAKGKTSLAKPLFLLITLTQAIYFSVAIRPNEMIELFTISIPVAAVILYRKYYVHVLFLLLTLIATLVSHLVLQENDSSALVVVNFMMVYLTVFLIVTYLKRLNQKQEKLLAIERNQALSDKQLIEKQAFELQELNEFKNNFFVNVSHEIRTPLTLISGYSKKLARLDQTDHYRQYAHIIAEQSAHIEQLTDSIIDLSKMEESQFSLRVEQCNLSRLLTEIYQDYQGLFADQSVNWQINLPEEDIYIRGDALMLRRAFTNLVTNALKFTPIRGTARIHISLDNTKVKVSFFNTGIGMPGKDLEKVFERFYQSPNHINQSQGSGIGLAFTKGIVEAHGFQISAYSQENQYARFEVQIPADQAQDNPGFFQKVLKAHPSEKSTKSNGAGHTLSGHTILLVEDHANMRKYIMDTQGLSEYRFIVAENGKEALEKVKAEAVDIVITDYMMPYMDGPTLVQQLQKLGFQKPVIVLTARTDAQSKLDMLRLGIDGYLTKPFLEEELLHLVNKALERDRMREEYLEQASESGEQITSDRALLNFNRQLTRLIDENLDKDHFDVNHLCDELHLTERTLYRKVKELCGSTPAKLITERRLLKARSLYEKKVYKSVRQLALAVGFKNSTRFSDKFYERFGLRP